MCFCSASSKNDKHGILNMTQMSEKAFKKSSRALFNEVGADLGITYAQSMQLLSKVLFSISYEEAKATILREGGRCLLSGGVDVESVIIIRNGCVDGDIFIGGMLLPKHDLGGKLPDLIFNIDKKIPLFSMDIFVKFGFDDIERSLFAKIVKRNYGFVKLNGFDYCLDEFKKSWLDVVLSGINDCGLSFDEAINAGVVYLSGGSVGADPEKTICLSLSDIINSKKVGDRRWVMNVNYFEDEICGVANTSNRFSLNVDI